MSDAVELRKLAKELQHAESAEKIVDVLRILQKDAVVTESSLRESKAGLAVGKLRSHASKDVADLAKELVKKWKNEVERQKQGGGKSSTSKQPPPMRKASVADSIGSPTTPTGSSYSTIGKDQTRSAKTDGVVVKATGDKRRDKCIELIYDSLCLDSDSPKELILKRAVAIESTVQSDLGATPKEYNTKIRSLYLNLKDKNNPGLRNNIVSGALPIEKFCKMTSQEMASEDRKAADAAIQEQNLHKSLGAEDPQAETSAFQCGKCKQWKTRYRQAQTRSADEPMTTFVTCVVCNNRWKFS
ncbi:hypothetical protein M0805_002541 [Coniferiporia weirii]|nr:hypothetical protein M0805_002541 [Coniferiporia weirii]